MVARKMLALMLYLSMMVAMVVSYLMVVIILQELSMILL
jgi:hypothetical protein